MKNIILFLFLIISNKVSTQIIDSIILNGKSIHNKLLNEITLTPLNLNSIEKIEYYRLKKKVLKVYPFALRTKKQLKEIEDDFLFLNSKREKRKISKLHDKWVREQFTDDIKKLTRSEGRILIKLIYNEIGMTSFDLIKKYRNGIQAFLWQRMAKLYDADLKIKFDPKNIKEDIWIEHILWEIRQKI